MDEISDLTSANNGSDDEQQQQHDLSSEASNAMVSTTVTSASTCFTVDSQLAESEGNEVTVEVKEEEEERRYRATSDESEDDQQEQEGEIAPQQVTRAMLSPTAIAVSRSIDPDSQSTANGGDAIITEEGERISIAGSHTTRSNEIKEDVVHGSTHNETNDSTGTSDETTTTTERTATSFEKGDHIYSWCSFWGIPRAYTHHGIVIDCDASAGTVTILDFSYLADEHDNTDGLGASSSSSSGANASSVSASSVGDDVDNNIAVSGMGGGNSNSILRSYTIDTEQAEKVWHEVRYDASWFTVWTRRAGTVSGGSFDSVDRVLARAEFLDKNVHLLSSYHLYQSNCEHVAVWCKTGRFCSLQLLASMRKSLALSTVPTVAVSTIPTTVPAAGFWGWFGYTTTVSLATAMPWLLPLAIVPTAVSAGKSVYDTTRWKQTTQSLNGSFEDWKLLVVSPG